MKYYIEEATVVETNETEPANTIETVRPEIIGEKKPKRAYPTSPLDSFVSGIFGMFDSAFGGFFGDDFFDDDPFGGLFGLGNLFEFDDDPQEYEQASADYQPQQSEPEVALVTETDEVNVQEIRYAYAEVLDE